MIYITIGISILILCITAIYISSLRIKYDYQINSTEWFILLKSLMIDATNKVARTKLITYIESGVSIDISSAEYRNTLIIYTNYIKTSLGSLYKDVYIKYIFRDETLFQDYLNMYLYNKIQEEVLSNISKDIDKANDIDLVDNKLEPGSDLGYTQFDNI